MEEVTEYEIADIVPGFRHYPKYETVGKTPLNIRLPNMGRNMGRKQTGLLCVQPVTWNMCISLQERAVP